MQIYLNIFDSLCFLYVVLVKYGWAIGWWKPFIDNIEKAVGTDQEKG